MGRSRRPGGQRGVHGGPHAGTPEHCAIRPAGGDLRRADVVDDFRPSHRHPHPGGVPGLHARDAVRGAGREQVLRLLPDLGRGDRGPDQPWRQRGAPGARHHAHLRLAVRHPRREPSPPEAGAAAGIHDAADGDRPAQPHHQGGVRLPAAAVLPARVPGLPVSRDRAHPRPARQAGGLDQRGGRDEYLPPSARGKTRQARRGDHAGRERRQGDLAAVPEPGGRPAGPDLPDGGPADADRAHPAGAAAGLGVGRGRLLRRRVLRRQHGPALPAPLRVRRGTQRLLQAAGQPAGRTGPPGQPVRRQPHAAGGEHPARGDRQAARRRAHPPVLAGRGRGRRAGCGQCRGLPAGAAAASGACAADAHRRVRPHHGDLAGPGPVHAQLDDPGAGAAGTGQAAAPPRKATTLAANRQRARAHSGPQ